MKETATTHPLVLIVDDEQSLRHYLELLLTREGFQVETAADADEALQHISRREPAVVLCDIRMPGALDGMGLLQSVREGPLSTEFIMMSAYGSRETALKAVQLGAYDYIDKPIQRDDLLLTLYKFLERERLRTENSRLRAALSGSSPHGDMVAQSALMQTQIDTARKVASFHTPVLITGESGTGKEMMARFIHRNSDRHQAPFVALNCGALPESLIESELFGYKRGSFTGANRDHTGLFESADGGVLFLDEVGELPLQLQVKLLRVLQENTIRRVGETRERPINVRILAASNRDLGAEVKAGRFRQDLFYRLNVVHLVVPPLRNRKEDLPHLVRHFLERLNHSLGKKVEDLAPETLRLLMEHDWPGNIRELRNAIERAILLEENNLLSPDNLPEELVPARPHNTEVPAPEQTSSLVAERKQENPHEGGVSMTFASLSIKEAVKQVEVEMIQRALEQTGGNRTAASKILDISQRALLYKIKQYGLS